MKVAVISTQSTVGKTAFITLLSAVFSRSQRKEVCILSTGHTSDNLACIEKTEGDQFSSPQIFKAMLKTAAEDPTEYFAYGIRQGSELVYLYDLLNMQIPKERLQDYFIDAMNKIPARLTLVEICGDIRSDFNQAILSNCDAVLCLATQTEKAPRKQKEVLSYLPSRLHMSCATIISQYDPRICSEKQLRAAYDTYLYKFPYSDEIRMQMYKGTLNRFGTAIVKGLSEAQAFMTPMSDIMQFLYNDPTHKVIGGVNTWLK